jgi:hypothetical protein
MPQHDPHREGRRPAFALMYHGSLSDEKVERGGGSLKGIGQKVTGATWIEIACEFGSDDRWVTMARRSTVSDSAMRAARTAWSRRIVDGQRQRGPVWLEWMSDWPSAAEFVSRCELLCVCLALELEPSIWSKRSPSVLREPAAGSSRLVGRVQGASCGGARAWRERIGDRPPDRHSPVAAVRLAP